MFWLSELRRYIVSGNTLFISAGNLNLQANVIAILHCSITIHISGDPDPIVIPIRKFRKTYSKFITDIGVNRWNSSI